ncbi:MAG: ATP-dependent DNA helicase [Myxococcales bacterium]|nr:ATP-dependent DNA helicase [Myxococcales bacterium]
MLDLTPDTVLGAGGLLSRVMPHYEPRPGQLAMAQAVLDAITDDGILLCEAATGTGKTLAYLVPALLSGRRVVIATGTRTLQDQIMEHDLPLLERAFGQPLPVACMKGLSNYLCLRRYHELSPQSPSLPEASRHQLGLVDAWLDGTESGDRAELSELPEDSALWSQLQSGSEIRIGPRCVHHAACFVTQMRQQAVKAQVVVVNHHLFFADLALRGPHGAAAIPDYDAVIFDEAHMVEDVATDFFGVALSSTRLSTLARDARRALSAAGLAAGLEPLVARLERAAEAFFTAVPRSAAEGGARMPLPPGAFEGRLREPGFALDDALEGLGAGCDNRAGDSEAVAQIGRRVAQIRKDLARLSEPVRGDKGATPVAWTMARGHGASVGASPIEVGAILREELFERGLGVVLTSATLRAEGRFDYLRSRLGIEAEHGAVEQVSESPFDYERQAALYLPPLPDPRAQGYLARAAAEIEALCTLTGGGALILCTSLRVMNELERRLQPRLGLPVYAQGQAPNAKLLARFRKQGDAVLLATASFFQGVDVPGRALRLLVIDKLPFDVPTDPLVAARCRAVEQAGGRAFKDYLLPSAALTLKQAFGRLIRGRDDRGVVAILDSRLSSKGYGKVLLRSLPPALRCRTMPELEAFWRSQPQADASIHD